MLTFLILLAAAEAPQSPLSRHSDCVKAEITRLAANDASARSNADAAMATCEPHLGRAAAEMMDRYTGSPQGQAAILKSGRPMPDLAPKIAASLRTMMHDMAMRGAERLRAGQPLTGLTGSGSFVAPIPSQAATMEAPAGSR